jgi:hypothetical protein
VNLGDVGYQENVQENVEIVTKMRDNAKLLLTLISRTGTSTRTPTQAHAKSKKSTKEKHSIKIYHEWLELEQQHADTIACGGAIFSDWATLQQGEDFQCLHRQVYISCQGMPKRPADLSTS